MKSLFQSKRLFYRPFQIQDAKDLFLLNADPDVIKYTGDAAFESIEAAEEFIKSYDHYQKHGFGRWAVILIEENRFIGWCGLKYNEENEIDIGFRFFKKEWGKGFASEAAEATIKYAKEELKMKSLVGRAAKENIASVRILQKLGFEFKSKKKCHGIEDALYFVLNI